MSVFNSFQRLYGWAVFNLYIKSKEFVKLLRNKQLYKSKSYYPELPQKSAINNFVYQIGQIIKYGRVNDYYFMYGLDVKSDKECEEYINYQPFMNRRDALNLNKLHNSSCILRNKLYFDIFAKVIGIPTPKIVAYYSKHHLYIYKDGEFKNCAFEELYSLGDTELFCKEAEGECGSGIFKLKIRNGLMSVNDKTLTAEQLQEKIYDTQYIMQTVVKQHKTMAKLYPQSINTIRMVTVRSLKDNEIHVMPSILRIGAHGSFVDNTSQGGIAVGFDLNTGQLHKYGFHKPKYGLRTDSHPDTGIILADFHIPMIQEAKTMAIRFHTMLSDIHSVGWDIAIGENGPVFIEGNDNWEINGPQVGNHGMRKEFEEYFFE